MKTDIKATQLKEGEKIKEVYQFVGFISEKELPRLKKQYYYLLTKQTDVMAEVFGGEARNVYVYKKV